ncbi:MAG: patatin-like phospholipase family protein, partial [Candidatus Binataceae bacterium]
ELGSKVCVLRPQPVPHPAEWYAAIEPADGMVVYEADHDGSQWTHLCLRQADRVLMLADAGSLAEVHADRTRQLLRGRRPATVELIILHGAGVRTPNLNGIPLDTYPAASHSHMREGNLADIARVTRTILNRAPGLVLSGGGARGFAHIGVIKALSEVGVPLDYFAGASMGSIIGAAAALEWDEAECRKHLVPAFVQQNPINDYMVPIVALARGRKVSRLLREHFGDALIEECWKPFFCTASNLSSGQVRVYRTGPLWQALRASVAIPGVITPVIEQGEIVVDGGVLNNMPIDLMLAMRRGPVIAVDVMRHHRMTAGLSNLEAASWRHLIRPARHGTPNIVALLMRVGTVGSEAQIRQLKARVDLLIEPPLEHIGTLDWKAYDRAVESGYRYTMELLEKRDSVALRI